MCYTVCILKRKIGDALCMFTKAPESFYVVRLFGVETCPFHLHTCNIDGYGV